MDNIAIIPARGGSKRIKRKNVKDFCGKPIISYSVETAIQSKLFKHVIVYTEDQEITEISNQYGAITPILRSQQNANDCITLTETLSDFLTKYDDIHINNICCILPTAIFTTKEDLLSSYFLFQGHDSLITIKQFEHPIQRAFKHIGNGQLFMLNPEFQMYRTQDLSPSYHDAGQFYWLNIKSFMQCQRIFMDDLIGYQMNTSIDIDTEEDWKLAELKYKLKKGLV